MSLIGHLLKGIASGGGWTAGKALADASVAKIKDKFQSREKETEEEEKEENLEDLEIAPEDEEK